jgi:flagellar biosynthesis/type III secretory pathway M-ring protein FliF/YscJ
MLEFDARLTAEDAQHLMTLVENAIGESSKRGDTFSLEYWQKLHGKLLDPMIAALRARNGT